MGERHLARLRRVRSLLEVKGFSTSRTVLARYSGAGFDDDLRAAAERDSVLLADPGRLYS